MPRKSPTKPGVRETIRLRAAVLSDARQIALLSGELGYPANPDVVRERLGEILSDPVYRVIVAEAPRRRLVGWLQAMRSVPLVSGLRVEITGLVVAADARRLGVGRRLVALAELWAFEIAAESVVVRSSAARKESHRFYPAIGYAASKTQVVYRKRTPA